MKDKIQDTIIREFEIFQNDREEIIEYLMELGDCLTPLKEEYKILKNKITGCLSEVWLISDLKNDKLFFYGYSNTKVTRGLLNLLCRVFSNQKIDYLINKNLYFIDKIGLNDFLGSQRTIGLNNMIKRIQQDINIYATERNNKKSISKKTIVEALKKVYDPELPVDICSLGLIYNISINEKEITILITLTSPNCPAAETIPKDIEENLKKIKNIETVKIDITFDPPYDVRMMSEEAKLELGFE